MPRPVTTATASSSSPVTSSAWSPSTRDDERRARDVRVGVGFRRAVPLRPEEREPPLVPRCRPARRRRTGSSDPTRPSGMTRRSGSGTSSGSPDACSQRPQSYQGPHAQHQHQAPEGLRYSATEWYARWASRDEEPGWTKGRDDGLDLAGASRRDSVGMRLTATGPRHLASDAGGGRAGGSIWVPAAVALLLAGLYASALLVRADGDASLLVHAAPRGRVPKRRRTR